MLENYDAEIRHIYGVGPGQTSSPLSPGGLPTTPDQLDNFKFAEPDQLTKANLAAEQMRLNPNSSQLGHIKETNTSSTTSLRVPELGFLKKNLRTLRKELGSMEEPRPLRVGEYQRSLDSGLHAD